MKTPCRNRCVFTAAAICEGCGRSQAEIRLWKKMTPYRRAAIERELNLPARMLVVLAGLPRPKKPSRSC
ncbi:MULTISPECIES: DUF1289 domain-containing protein [Lysobacteraceae]|uniref:Fe-S oxidoreductase n=1 Tax=Xanthomonas hortorum pv. gardneri TaxID=2754056 RepID=A0A6V7FGK2_9XANT|nr:MULTISPECIES: DUF1289 domain-containing protein [Xanthomonas]APP82698.1 hypothetical protein BJD10_23775 [Xanthomonas hortorum pv. gardneri]APR13331.1 hypothetical protein BI314_24175 [Xanthomonas citri pv. citri]APR17828.1 hypothetical protein BI315_23310 [Xanthomonas citri pv. citri]APR22662.1 hypothetical protein BI316_24135 [Xanthomonas citri pv. citri]APR27300.1 hypothetical protein BJD09_24005 [Xanthomonas citri pv. citri]